MPAQLQDSEVVLKYLLSLLTPEQKDELNQLRGKNATVSADPDDDLAEDALKGRIAMDRLPPRLRRLAMSRCRPDRTAATSAFAERFPDAAKVRNL